MIRRSNPGMLTSRQRNVRPEGLRLHQGACCFATKVQPHRSGSSARAPSRLVHGAMHVTNCGNAAASIRRTYGRIPPLLLFQRVSPEGPGGGCRVDDRVRYEEPIMLTQRVWC